MTRWLLVLAVTVASSTASAQLRSAPQPVAATTAAEVAAKSAERQVAQLSVHRASLAKRYKSELDQIDRLKNQRASWRRDRELRDNLSSSLETANQLSSATRDLEKAKARLAGARRSYLTAIDAELNAGPTPARAQQLSQAKAQLTPQVMDAPRRIVIPDFDIDPLADPEELDQRAAELRAAEDELGRQLAGLEVQTEELDRLVVLRKQHDRAGDLFNRDDDEPHRNAVRPTESAGTGDGAGGGIHPEGEPPPGNSSFESFVPITLVDVLDSSTMSSLAAALRSGDPAQRAAAAHQAHDAVARRFVQVKNRRLEIEAQARALRSKR